MMHVIIDRPRTGGDGGKSKPLKGTKKLLQRQMKEENTVAYESTARRHLYGYNCKQLNEHLSPLVRWLQKQCGRNWNEVWSEICEGLSVRNLTSAHVRNHADDFVEKNCIYVEGKLCNSKGLPLNLGWGRWHKFYVDPVDGVLREFGDRPKYRRKKKLIKNYVESGKNNFVYYLIDDIWYEIEFKEWNFAWGVFHKVWDFIFCREVIRSECRDFYGFFVYAAVKRQLNKKEIRQLKLWEKLK